MTNLVTIGNYWVRYYWVVLSCDSRACRAVTAKGKVRLPMSRLQQTYKYIFNLHLRTRYIHALLCSIISSNFDFYQDYTKLINTTDNRAGSAVFWLNFCHSFLWRIHMTVHSLFKKQNNQKFLLLPMSEWLVVTFQKSVPWCTVLLNPQSKWAMCWITVSWLDHIFSHLKIILQIEKKYLKLRGNI